MKKKRENYDEGRGGGRRMPSGWLGTHIGKVTLLGTVSAVKSAAGIYCRKRGVASLS